MTISKTDEAKLSAPGTKAGRYQRACLELLYEHERRGELPTNGHFLFYELEQRGHVPKHYEGLNPDTGKPYRRTPLQDISVALMHLRECGLVPWKWIEDETRDVDHPAFAPTIHDYVMDAAGYGSIDLWGGEEPPFVVCESRAVKGVLGSLAYEYLHPLTATGGQCGGFIVTDIVPLLLAKRRVLYIGDFELRGPADQIEANTRRYIEEHAGRTFEPDEWIKIALTAGQVKASARLQRLTITKLDNRYKPARPYQAVECEAMGQGALVQLVRRHLDRLLPEPIEAVRKREERQRVAVRRWLASMPKRRRT